MEKVKESPGWRDEISAGCIIPGTRIVLLDMLEDDQGQIRGIRLNLGTRDIVFRFIHCPKDGTFGDILVWEPDVQTYSTAGRTRTKLHPKDKYDPAIGIRMVARRLLDGLSSSRLGGDPKEIYRAVRTLVPGPAYVESPKVPEASNLASILIDAVSSIVEPFYQYLVEKHVL